MRTSNEVQAENASVITKKDLRKVFWKSLPFEISWNYVRQDHMGFAYSMTPVLEKLYKTKEDRAEALGRHMEFFNITVYFSTLVLGIVTAMEERRAKDPGFDTSSISNDIIDQQCKSQPYGAAFRNRRFHIPWNAPYHSRWDWSFLLHEWESVWSSFIPSAI